MGFGTRVVPLGVVGGIYLVLLAGVSLVTSTWGLGGGRDGAVDVVDRAPLHEVVRGRARVEAFPAHVDRGRRVETGIRAGALLVVESHEAQVKASVLPGVVAALVRWPGHLPQLPAGGVERLN